MEKNSETGEDLNGAPEFDPEDFEPRPFTPPSRKRVGIAVAVVVVLICVIVLPPLISVNGLQRRIASSLTESLGRPVQMEAVTLNVLPWPGFTLKQFVVGEDPSFGTEPVIRAESVTARIRLRSLWRRKVEFSRITLDEPSVNLVRRADGRWNVESIQLKAPKTDGAAPVPATPTRFPYISATSARVNIKLGPEKMPISLTEADFALWQPQPDQWRLRLEAHPTRTDAAATDTGTLRLQGTLGKASDLKNLPVDLTAEWRAAPLGAMSRMILGHDGDMRGQMTLRINIKGTAGSNVIDTQLALKDVRRAEFVPADALNAEFGCRVASAQMFHQISEIRCEWKGDQDKSGIVATGQVPDITDMTGTNSGKAGVAASGTINLRNVPAESLVDALRLGSTRVSPDLHASGKLGGSLELAGESGFSGPLMVNEAVVTIDSGVPVVDGGMAAEVGPGEVTVRPIGLKLGAPAPASLDAHIDNAGYTMHLSGTVMRTRLLQLAHALPQFGDGLAAALPAAANDAGAQDETPLRVDLVSNHPWGGGQVWTAAGPAKPGVKRRGSRQR